MKLVFFCNMLIVFVDQRPSFSVQICLKLFLKHIDCYGSTSLQEILSWVCQNQKKWSGKNNIKFLDYNKLYAFTYNSKLCKQKTKKRLFGATSLVRTHFSRIIINAFYPKDNYPKVHFTRIPVYPSMYTYITSLICCIHVKNWFENE